MYIGITASLLEVVLTLAKVNSSRVGLNQNWKGDANQKWHIKRKKRAPNGGNSTWIIGRTNARLFQPWKTERYPSDIGVSVFVVINRQKNIPETLARLIPGRVTWAQSVWARCNLQPWVFFNFDCDLISDGIFDIESLQNSRTLFIAQKVVRSVLVIYYGLQWCHMTEIKIFKFKYLN